ncbi:MAG: SDR family NAD(P)-dependent oxidoreductase [Desulfobacterales bacterium]
MKIENCVAVVSGGASGLGAAVVKELTENGAKAAILDFDLENGEKLALELGDKVIFCKTDVTDAASVKSAIDRTMEAFGAIHFAVNCAGVASPKKVIDKKGNPMPADFFNRVIQINLVGTMNVLSLAAVEMCKNTPTEDGEKGAVINVAPVAAFEAARWVRLPMRVQSRRRRHGPANCPGICRLRHPGQHHCAGHFYDPDDGRASGKCSANSRR